MKIQLITGLDHNIIVSDEEIKRDDWYFDDCDEIRQSITSDKDYWSVRKEYKKIIAGLPNLPSIDFNGLEEKFGIIDVEKLATDHAKEHWGVYFNDYHPDVAITMTTGEISIDDFKKGFEAAQSLNDKKYSLKDMLAAFDSGLCAVNGDGRTISDALEDFYSLAEYLAQQPKVFDIEVESEYYADSSKPYSSFMLSKPKITNNSIKIINTKQFTQ